MIIILIIFYKLDNSYNLLLIKKNNINNLNSHYIIQYNNTFIIMKIKCKGCGLFAIYKNSLQCINTFINKGYIPIIDLISYPNMFNNFNSTSSNENPWELFFHQPYKFSLEKVKANSKHIIFLDFPNFKICKSYGIQNILLKSRVTLEYWHNIALKYIPIKQNILDESNSIIQKLFKNNKNILGILVRGTDYISVKPKGEAIPPSPQLVINDILELDKNNKYTFFFLTTEDEIIFQKFKKKFGKKLKYIHKNINYNYTEKKLVGFNKNIGNINFQKLYLINIVILSTCIDIISASTNGLIGAMILSKGFRYSKIYDLGSYKN